MKGDTLLGPSVDNRSHHFTLEMKKCWFTQRKVFVDEKKPQQPPQMSHFQVITF